MPLEKKEKKLFCFWQKIVIMYDNNILTFLAFLYSVPAIGAEVFRLNDFDGWQEKGSSLLFCFSGFKATLEKVFLLTFVNFKHLSQSSILSESSQSVLEKAEVVIFLGECRCLTRTEKQWKWVSQCLISIKFWLGFLVFFKVSASFHLVFPGSHLYSAAVLHIQKLRDPTRTKTWNFTK